jgi:acyl dehydratase
MAIDYQKLKSWPFQEIVQPYTAKDCILYALGLGLGADPLDRNQLRFVYEDNLQMLPTMPVVLASPGFWLRDPGTGVEWKTVLHGEQGLTIHRPLPAAATVVGTTRIEEIIDKGSGKGALIYTRRELRDQHSGELLCSLSSTSFCRSEGGFGGPSGPTRPPHELPARAFDLSCDLPTLPQAALIYRLSGDYNPLHADPGVAAAAGFRQPILHGLCSYGVAGHALLKMLCGYDATRLRRMDARFSAPVYPGETIRTECWHEGRGRASFRARVVERDVVVLNNGLAEYSE